jgi:hypothetical protein
MVGTGLVTQKRRAIMSEVKTVYGGFAPSCEATVQEPLHLPNYYPIKSEVAADDSVKQIAPEDLGRHLDECQRMCRALVAAGWSPVELHDRAFLWTRPGDPQLYPRGLALQMMEEGKTK